MAKLEFENLEFREEKDKKDSVRVTLLEYFYFYIKKQDIMKIGDFQLKKNSIEFKGISEKKAASFYFLISKCIKDLNNSLNKKPAVYIHRNSGIPLIGCLSFGIVDRGTTMIELKPITGCNINCVFCSVDEGLSGKKMTDYVVEEEYLADELNKLIEYKKRDMNDIEIYINPHGEPLLYADIFKLIEDVSKMKHVKNIVLVTNGTLLTEKIIDRLEESGLNQINISVNSLDEKNARMLAGTANYDVKKIKDMAEYSAKKGLRVVLAPVWIKGMNDNDIKKIAGYAKENGFGLGIQKYVAHKKGRHPAGAKEAEWEDFFSKLNDIEREHDVKAFLDCAPEKTKELLMPFRSGDIIKARIVCDGRHSNQKIAAAKGRSILVLGCSKKEGEAANIRIKKAKSNIFVGECIN